jgi:hypothetical protein
MAAEFSNQIDWDGQALYIEAATDAGRVTCRVPRDTVHVIRLYSDAIGREIYLERHRIVQKLAPFLRAKLSFAEAGQVIELLPCDVRIGRARLRSGLTAPDCAAIETTP